MIANVNKNNSKLVAAIVAMAMIVCAIAVVAMPTDAAAGTDGKPTMDFTGDAPVEVDAVSDLTTSIGFNSTTGVLTIKKDTVLNITGTVGSASPPRIKQIALK